VSLALQVLGTPLQISLPVGLPRPSTACVGLRFTTPSSSSAVQVRRTEASDMDV